jgi:outer membrane lipoprotein
MSIWKPLVATAATLVLAACATVPAPLQGGFAPLDPAHASEGGASGTPVRWGGTIISTEPGEQQTCFYVLSQPLDASARPREGGASMGRFVACHAGFYDPEVFTKGREITVTGTVHGTVSRKVGQYDYAYPRVEASTVYLWAPRPDIVRYRDPFYDPWWGPGFGPWYDPFWYQPRVIVVRPVHRPPPPPPQGK